MKKLILIVFLLFQLVLKAEIINNYEVDININKNGVLDITERITYLPESSRKRGIIRIIPYKYDEANYFKIEDRTLIKDFRAIYLNDNNYLEIKDISEDNVMAYRLGSSEIFLDSDKEYIYEFKYSVYNSLRTKDGITQSYFNPIGSYWDMPIKKYLVKISGMDGEISVFTGKTGESNDDYEIQKLEDGSFVITNKSELEVGEGMSYILNSNSFKYLKQYELYNKFMANPGLFVAPIFFVIVLILNLILFIRKRIYYLSNEKVVVVNYMPPETDVLLAKKIDNKNEYTNILIIIYELIKKDVIKFREKNKIHENEEYVLKYGENKVHNRVKKFNDYVEKLFYIDEEKYREEKENLTKYEKIALSKLYLSKNDIFKSEKQLYLANEELENRLYLDYESKYIKKRFNIFILINIILIAINIGLLVNFFNSFFEFVAINMFMLIISLVYSLTFIRYKEDYFNDKKEVEGFKEFLYLVEKDKFEHFGNNINDLIDYFKKILPYALALGLKSQYMKLVDRAINEYSLDRETMYNYTYYYYLTHATYYNGIINKRFETYKSLNSHGGNSSFKGIFSSSGSVGGGFGGGGGKSW